jgi:hypothetical protein
MPYKVTFYCGAELVVETSPRQQKKYQGMRKTTARNGLLRVVVWSYLPGAGPYKPGMSVKLPNEEKAYCRGCKGFRRKSGRVAYECFPADFEVENKPGGKYDGKRFPEFCERVIACFPKTVVKLPSATPLVAPATGNVAERVNQDNELIEGME